MSARPRSFGASTRVVRVLGAIAISTAVITAVAGCLSAPPTARPDVAATIAQHLQDDFGQPGDTTWYSHIRNVGVVGDMLVMDTDVQAAMHSIATEICSGASTYVFSNVADPSLRAVEVRSATGEILVLRDSV
ncbi:MAG: hypothetical protein QOI92_2297, partial [Chloroflexota bacterium]|nr:hypothetical protein [Chloroflexota bacterium]